jgi:hypothetical protein
MDNSNRNKYILNLRNLNNFIKCDFSLLCDEFFKELYPLFEEMNWERNFNISESEIFHSINLINVKTQSLWIETC